MINYSDYLVAICSILAEIKIALFSIAVSLVWIATILTVKK